MEVYDFLFIDSASAPVPPTSSSLFATSASSASTVTLPGSIQAGDIILLWQYAYNFSSLPAEVVPAGYTTIINHPNGVQRNHLAYRIADGSEGGTTITGMAGSTANYKWVQVIRPNTAANSLVGTDTYSTQIAGNPAAKTHTISGYGSDSLVIVATHLWANAQATSANTSSTPASTYTHQNTTQQAFFRFYSSGVSGRATSVVVDMNDIGNGNTIQSAVLLIN